MQTLEYHFRDKAGWGAGPWHSEPDKRQWADEATGLPCLIVRGPHGALCGYVGVPESHPWFGLSYSHYDGGAPQQCDAYEGSPENVITVHGGLTFSDFCADGEPEHGICHRPDEGEPDRVWWFGFDCAHSGDYSPKYDREFGWAGDVYRDQAYVEAECASLAQQLVTVADPSPALSREGAAK